MNLLEETLGYMEALGKTSEDVLCVRMTKDSGLWRELDDSYPEEIIIDFDDFVSVANHEYDDDYGSNEVNWSTLILFKDNSAMRRWEYDGSEGWEYITLPKETPKKYSKKTVVEFLWGRDSCYAEEIDEQEY